MQEIQGNMDDVLPGNDLRDDEKDKRYFQLQNRNLALSLLTGFIVFCVFIMKSQGSPLGFYCGSILYANVGFLTRI